MGFTTNHLLSSQFNFTTERFVRLPLPIPSFNLPDRVVLSVVRDEKLSVLHIDGFEWSDVISIWVTDKVDEELSWRSDFVLRVDFDKFDLRNLATSVSSFLLDEENKMAVCCDGTRIYIVGEDIYKLVYKEITVPSPPRPLVITYVPSLVKI
ncbi:unnamed protein product [Eruca vesicaria subsp. sativa]|uniref:F-box associated beta-propeller type 1 domain-containing protein n=1 Tax=Eruca vesicaria subsp. sativa TaxID=29727 RepID=A0ABC8L4C7_ERUVS|nr:unnamed protein product [Eruca vesicaria subsp. sativa]